MRSHMFDSHDIYIYILPNIRQFLKIIKCLESTSRSEVLNLEVVVDFKATSLFVGVSLSIL